MEAELLKSEMLELPLSDSGEEADPEMLLPGLKSKVPSRVSRNDESAYDDHCQPIPHQRSRDMLGRLLQ